MLGGERREGDHPCAVYGQYDCSSRSRKTAVDIAELASPN